jgi:hypothetical protein
MASARMPAQSTPPARSQGQSSSGLRMVAICGWGMTIRCRQRFCSFSIHRPGSDLWLVNREPFCDLDQMAQPHLCRPRFLALSPQHTGTVSMGEIVDQWKPFTSRQRAITKRAGQVWDGRTIIMPALSSMCMMPVCRKRASCTRQLSDCFRWRICAARAKWLGRQQMVANPFGAHDPRPNLRVRQIRK